MNHWTELSIEYANQKSYLDDLFKVYPISPEGIREINQEAWNRIEDAFKRQDNEALLESLLKLNLFPIKDSYVAYLRKDKGALKRNPATVARLCGRLYEMGLTKSILVVPSRRKPTARSVRCSVAGSTTSL